jgi:biotin carboxylase
MSYERVLVAGTTSDYIDLILRRHPGRALFLTDRAHRADALESAPGPDDEVLSDLSDPVTVLTDLRAHLRTRDTRLAGITCYDCDSLMLAAQLGQELGLPYPSAAAVAACRSKFICKDLWHAAGVPCPAAAEITTLEQAAAFLDRTGAPAVLKPVDGCGSELVFLCRTAKDLREAHARIQARHAAAIPAASPIPRLVPPATPPPAPAGDDEQVTRLPRVFVIEEYIEGPEYSADFLLDENGCRIIRVASKIMAPAPLGTTLAYQVPADPPAPLTFLDLEHAFESAARSLGLERTPCMIDFIVRAGEPVLLEIAPRPGGDCLPPLIRASSGLDMLGLAIDFAARREPIIPPRSLWRSLVGLRLLAPRGGIVTRFDDSALRADPRVVECHLTRQPGHCVTLPPCDYDSRVLGYVVFAADSARPVAGQCRELSGQLGIEWSGPRPLGAGGGSPRGARDSGGPVGPVGAGGCPS